MVREVRLQEQLLYRCAGSRRPPPSPTHDPAATGRALVPRWWLLRPLAPPPSPLPGAGSVCQRAADILPACCCPVSTSPPTPPPPPHPTPTPPPRDPLAASCLRSAATRPAATWSSTSWPQSPRWALLAPVSRAGWWRCVCVCAPCAAGRGRGASRVTSARWCSGALQISEVCCRVGVGGGGRVAALPRAWPRSQPKARPPAALRCAAGEVVWRAVLTLVLLNPNKKRGGGDKKVRGRSSLQPHLAASAGAARPASSPILGGAPAAAEQSCWPAGQLAQAAPMMAPRRNER
jgi:hypothetical protein